MAAEVIRFVFPDNIYKLIAEIILCAGLAYCYITYMAANPQPTVEQQKAAEQYGGADTDTSEDEESKNDLSCNKGSHKCRSLQNQPNHKEYWKNKNKKGK